VKVRVGDKVVEAELRNGVPTVKAAVERITRPDGTVDVIVKVPCLKILGEPNGESNL